MRSSFRWLVVIGVLFIVASWLAGPGRRAVAARKVLAPTLQGRVWAYVALAIVTAVLLLTGPVADFTRFLAIGVLVALGAVWIELTRAQTVREFPAAQGPELFVDTRARLEGWWGSRRAPVTTAGPVDITAQLGSLADLHAQGELTDAEYAAAKARVLAGGS
jgi:hypothetical protein